MARDGQKRNEYPIFNKEYPTANPAKFAALIAG